MTDRLDASAPAPVDLEAAQPRRRLDRWSWVAFAVQLAGMVGFLGLERSRTWEQSADVGTYLQAEWLLGHGHLNPFSTMIGIPFIDDHLSIGLWAFAPLGALGSFAVLVGVAASVAAACVVAFRWLLSILALRVEAIGERRALWLGVLGLGLLTLNPFLWWSLLDGLHPELVAMPFALGAAWALERRRHGVAVACVLGTALFGDVTASWLVGLGLSALVVALLDASRRRELLAWAGGLVLGAGAMVGMAGLLGADKGTSVAMTYKGLLPPTVHPTTTGILAAPLRYPGRVASVVEGNLARLAVLLAPTLGLGLLAPWTFGVPLVVLVEGAFTGGHFYSSPDYQTLPLATFGAVGAIVVLAWLSGRSRRAATVATVLGMLLAVELAVLSITLLPAYPRQWLGLPATASAFHALDARIPADDQVVASASIVAAFAQRSDVTSWPRPGQVDKNTVPLSQGPVWFVLRADPLEETAPQQWAMAWASRQPGARYVGRVVDATVIELPASKSPRTMTMAVRPSSVPAWTGIGPRGRVATEAQPWRATASRGGLVVDLTLGDHESGRYAVGVHVAAPAGSIVSVDDVTAGTTLASHRLRGGAAHVRLSVDVHDVRRQIVVGWGPIALPAPKSLTYGDQLVVHVVARRGPTVVGEVTLRSVASSSR
jgi:hypothetical protein